MGALGGVVLDGRDIGTAVFPDADVKFYVDADPARRAVRRHAELAAAGAPADLAAIEREIRERDHADSTRADSPLTRAAGAIAHRHDRRHARGGRRADAGSGRSRRALTRSGADRSLQTPRQQGS